MDHARRVRNDDKLQIWLWGSWTGSTAGLKWRLATDKSTATPPKRWQTTDFILTQRNCVMYIQNDDKLPQFPYGEMQLRHSSICDDSTYLRLTLKVWNENKLTTLSWCKSTASLTSETALNYSLERRRSVTVHSSLLKPKLNYCFPYKAVRSRHERL